MLGSLRLMCSSAFGSRFLIQEISRKTPPCGVPAAFLDLAHDAARDVIAGEQFRRTARVLVALGVTPALFFVVGRLRFVVLRNEIEHETFALFVRQDAAFAAHAFGYEHPAHTRRPDHAGGMELDVFHVDQLRSGVVGERMAVTSAIPTVARDLVRFADAAGGEDDRLSLRKIRNRPRSRS